MAVCENGLSKVFCSDILIYGIDVFEYTSLGEIMIKIENDINWSNCFIEQDVAGVEINCYFEITPDEFLRHADDCLKKSLNKMDVINAVLNSKQAIDCQIDSILVHLGFDYLKFNTIMSIKEFMGLERSVAIDGENRKISFINQLGIAPKLLISQYRKIRNSLEHEYKLPTVCQAKEFVELAELFINATSHKWGVDMYRTFTIKNDEQQTTYNMYIDADDTKDGHIEIRSYRHDKDTRHRLIVASSELMYVELLSCIIKKQFDEIPRILGYNFPRENVNIQYW